MIARRLLITLLTFSSFNLTSLAAVFVPDWNGQAGTTSALFSFTDANKLAPPTTSQNPFGSVRMLIENETSLGAGWMDPSDPYHLTRGGANGAWDLGQHGLISIVVPVAENGEGSINTVDLFLHVVWHQGPMGSPKYEVNDLIPSHGNTSNSLLQPDGPGAWHGTTWEAVFDNITDDELTISIRAPWNGAVVDSVAVYTRSTPIPEPSSFILTGIAAAGLIVFRRRSSERNLR